MDKIHSLVLVLVISAVTIALRVIPFVIFGNKKTPKSINYLGDVLPYAIMGMLVVYCLKGISFAVAPYGLWELVSVLVVVVVHIWKRSTLLSIVSGTLCYMLLLRI